MPPETPQQQNPASAQPPQGGAPEGAPTPPPPTPVDTEIPQAPPQQGSAEEEKKDNPYSAQNSLLIAELRDSLVVMRDGSFRAVLECESINFDLMSEQEREAVEQSYQDFLNSLDVPIQILIRSQRVDIGPYITRLADIRRNQDNMLLGALMDDYINFIDVLSQEANIMDKSFYVVIPYYPSGDLSNVVEQSRGFFKNLLKGGGPQVTRVSASTYAKARQEMGYTINAISNGLLQIGIQNKLLDTAGLSQLYYNAYNPDIAIRQPLGDPKDLASIYTTKAKKDKVDS